MKALGKITGRFFWGAAVLAVAVGLSLWGCSKDPSGGGVTGDDPDRPGRSGQLKVQTSVLTRSAVDGTVLPAGSAIGVVVTTTDGSAYFTPSATSGSGSADGGYYPDGRNVRFCNETGVNTWTSTTADGKTRLLLFSGEDKGKVYGYYPWTEDADIEGEGSSATIPVGILREGTIVVDAADAATDKPAYTAQGETDYMYSSRSDEVGTATTTTARLVMEHALSRVSFRMYASAAAQAAVEGDEGSYYEFTGYTLRNRNGSEDLVARFDENTRMSVSTGEITGALSGGEYVRRIEGYRLERSKGNTPDDDNTAANGSLRVGHLCFPLASIGHDGGKTTGLEAVFEVRRMRGDGTVASAPAAYALPLAVVPDESDKWLSGKHYTYTVKFTGSSLSVESVTVTRWNEVAGGNMNIGEDPYVGSAAVAPDGDIPVQGATYGITLEGILPLAGVEVRACIDELPGSILGKPEPLATGTVTASGTAVELTIPANTGVERTVVFEYKLNGTWTKIAERTWKSRIGELYGGGVIYWVDPDDASDFRVVSLNEPPSTLAWAASTGYVLGSGAQGQTARNGADVWKLALASSEGRLSGESGVFATDYPAFEYCYNKTDGGVAKGTWYLPSLQELMDLYNAKRNIQSVIAAGDGTAFSAGGYWSATEYGTGTSNTWGCEFGFGLKSGISKTSALKLRCVRGKGEVEPYVSSAAVSPDGDISGGGGAYGITLKGLLPSDGVEVRANISGADPLTGKATAPGTPVELNIPANTTGAARTVVFEYKWNGTWKKIVECSQAKLPSVGELYGGGVVYWADPADASNFRVVALDQSSSTLKWAASEDYVLGDGARNQTARNGADVWKIAKRYSDNKTNGASGTFATDFPAFSYCYEKTDGNVPKGTWYLPSKQELKDLESSRGRVDPVISDNEGTAIYGGRYWTATESTVTVGGAWEIWIAMGPTSETLITGRLHTRCLRDGRQ